LQELLELHKEDAMNIGQILANKGRLGDTMVAHISPQEAAILKAFGGAGTKNPKTGLPEFWSMQDFMNSFGGQDDFSDQNISYADSRPGGAQNPAPTAPAQQETAPQAVAPVGAPVGQAIAQAPAQAPAQAVKPQYTQPNYDSPEGGGLGGGESYASTRPPEEQVYANGVPVISSDAYDAKYAGYKTPQQIIDEANQKATVEYNKTRPLDFFASNFSPEGMDRYDDPKSMEGRSLIKDKYGNYIFYDDQYQAQNPKDTLTGPNVKKLYEDPTKYYHDFDDPILKDKGYGLYTTPDGKTYLGDKTGKARYDLDWDKDNKTATVDVDGKKYNVRRGDETKFSYYMPTTEDMQKADYSGKYDATVAADPEWQKGKWDDFGNGWKTKTFYGQTYYAMPGDDVTKAGYTGLTEDQVKNWYTTDGTNYSGGTAWGKDPVSGDYFRPLTTLSTSTGTPEEGSAPVFETGMNRKLRPGEENSGMGVIGDLMGHLEWVVPAILSMGMGAEIGQGLTSSIGQGGGGMGGAAYYPASGAHSMGGGLLGGSLGGSTTGGIEGLGASAAAPSLTSSIGNWASQIPSALSNLSWGSLAPSSLKSVLLPAAIGGGVRGMQTDWDLMEMLKGAGIGAASGWGLDRLGAAFNSISGSTPNSVAVSGRYGESPQAFDSGTGLWKDYVGPQSIEDWYSVANPNDVPSVSLSGRYGQAPQEFYDPKGIWKNYVGPQSIEDWYSNLGPNDARVLSGGYGTIPKEFYSNTDIWKDYVGPQSMEDWYSNINPNDATGRILSGRFGEIPKEFYDSNGPWKDYVGPQSTEDWWKGIDPNDRDVWQLAGPPDEFYDPNGKWKDYVGPQSAEDWWKGMNPNDNYYWDIQMAPTGGDWRIEQPPGDWAINSNTLGGDWAIQSGGSSFWDWLNSIPGLASKLLPLVPLLTGGVTVPPGGGEFPFPVGGGEASSSGGASFTGSEGVNASGTGGAGRESAQARASRIAAIQALQDEINKKFSGQLYYS
jgi:hypothetical protein